MWIRGEVRVCPSTLIQSGILTLLPFFLIKIFTIDIITSVLQIGKLRLRINKSITQDNKIMSSCRGNI